jgi:hypothetical protein
VPMEAAGIEPAQGSDRVATARWRAAPRRAPRRQPRREPPAWNGLLRKVEFPGLRTLARQGAAPTVTITGSTWKDASAGADEKATREAERTKVDAGAISRECAPGLPLAGEVVHGAKCASRSLVPAPAAAVPFACTLVQGHHSCSRHSSTQSSPSCRSASSPTTTIPMCSRGI